MKINYKSIHIPGKSLITKLKYRLKNKLTLIYKNINIFNLTSIFFTSLIFPTVIIASEFDPSYLYKNVSKSIVAVAGSDTTYGKKSIGAGSIINNDGIVLTNAHVIINKKNKKPFKKLFVLFKPDRLTGVFKNDISKTYQCKLLHYSRKLDLAILQIIDIPTPLPPAIKFADSTLVSIGDPVIAIGHPESGGLWSLTTGTISSKINSFQNISGKNVFQTEASLNRGNSGGPLIDGNGFLVGVNSMFSKVTNDGLPITGINFSIMSNVAVNWLRSLKFDVNFSKPHHVKKPSSIQEAGIIPVPELKIDTTNKVLPLINYITSPYLEKNRTLKVNISKFFENDLEDMIRSMRSKIENKRISFNENKKSYIDTSK